MSPNNCCNHNPNCHDIKQNGNIVLASHWKYDALVRHKVCCCCWRFKEIVRSYFETRLAARVPQLLHVAIGRLHALAALSVPSLQSCVWHPWQVFCEDPSLTLITNSHQRLLSRAVVSKEIDVQIEELYCVGSVLVSRKYNRNPISLALEFDTRQWAWYLDSVHRGPHNITVSSHSHISHDDPAQKSGQVGHQQSAVYVSWP